MKPHLELTLQDYFFLKELEQTIEPVTPVSDIPISDATWIFWFEGWLEAMISSLPIRYRHINHYELALRLTDDPEIRSLNLHYRGQDASTDVLAFAALEAECPQVQSHGGIPLYLGDIVISVPTAQHQANEQHHSLMTELGWLAVHGFLHLFGWDHPDQASLERMLKQQLKLLKLVDAPFPRFMEQIS